MRNLVPFGGYCFLSPPGPTNPEIGDTFHGRFRKPLAKETVCTVPLHSLAETETGCLDGEHGAAFQCVPVGARTDENLHLPSLEARLAFGAWKTQVVCA